MIRDSTAEAGELVMGAALEGIKWIERGAAVGQQYDALESHYTFGTPMFHDSGQQLMDKTDQMMDDYIAAPLTYAGESTAHGVHWGIKHVMNEEYADLLTPVAMMALTKKAPPILKTGARSAGRLLNTGMKAASQMRMKLFDIRSSYTVDWKGMSHTHYSGLPFPKIKIKQTLEETAAQRVAENPMLMKQYVQHMEKITELKLHPTQVEHLKEVLRTTKFEKLSKEATDLHRAQFDKLKASLRKEWEIETGQRWPVYNVEVVRRGQRVIETRNYDAHHIIQNNHAGPNKWWNIHPALPKQHSRIHGSHTPGRAIFNGSIKGGK